MIDPDRPAALQKVEIETSPPEAQVLVDGAALASHEWILAPGTHTIVARAPDEDATSRPVTITVR